MKAWIRDVQRLFDRMGVAYQFESGSRHWKVKIEKDGKKGMVIVPHTNVNHRGLDFMKQCVRRELG